MVSGRTYSSDIIRGGNPWKRTNCPLMLNGDKYRNGSRSLPKIVNALMAEWSTQQAQTLSFGVLVRIQVGVHNTWNVGLEAAII